MSQSIIVSYNSANPKDFTIVNQLSDYLNLKKIHVDPYDPNVAAPMMRQQLLNATWLILILTPQAIQSPQLQSLVNTAFGSIKQGHMQGVLALVSSSNPVELEDLPPLWSTIRIYYTGERNDDLQQTFEKLSRTLDDRRVIVPATTPSQNNWAPSFSSAASRPQPTMQQTTRRSQSRLFIPIVASLALIIFILAYFLSTKLIFNHPSTPTPNVQATATAAKASTAIARASATAHANATATAQANATVTAVSQDNLLYTNDTSGTPNLTSLNGPDTNNLWKSDSAACVLNSDSTYHVMSTLVGHYKLCMANITNFTNFVYQVKMTIISGDAGGLIFRSDGADHFYRFSLNSNGIYALFVCQSSICSDTKFDSGKKLETGSLKGIGQDMTLIGQPMTLAVIAKDKNIYLYINGMFEDEVNNANFSQIGEIGVYAASELQPTEVAFSDMKVWKL